MKSDKSIAVFAMVASLFLAVGAGSAQTDLNSEPTGATVDQVANLTGFTESTSDSVVLNGGNITSANLSADQVATDWAAIVGTATGKLALGSGANTLYEWSGAQPTRIFAYESALGSINWSGLTDETLSDLDGNYTNVDGAESFSNTYDAGSNDVAFDAFSSVTGPSAKTNSNSSATWTTTGIADVEGGSNTFDPIFVGEVNTTGYSFRAVEADYQMLLPSPDDTSTTYNLYVELGQ